MFDGLTLVQSYVMIVFAFALSYGILLFLLSVVFMLFEKLHK